MADNLKYTDPAAGNVDTAFDQIGTVFHQRSKIEFGDDGSATDVSAINPLPVTQQADLTVGPTSVSSATTIFSQDCTNLESVAVQVTSAGTTCTITYEQSNDNSNWLPCTGQAINATTGVPVSTSTTANIFIFQVPSRYFRARVSTYTSGTVTAIGYFRVSPITPTGGNGVQAVLASGTVTTLTSITNWGNVVDNAAFTDGTTRVMPSGYIYDEVAGTALTENDAAAARIDEKRAQVHILEDGTTRGRRATVTAAGALSVGQIGAATPAQSSVAGSATSVSLLAANSNRLGATIYNDSTAVLYVKLGATASTSSFSALLDGNGSGIGGYYEVPSGYTGAIDGIWASAAGNARITEVSA